MDGLAGTLLVIAASVATNYVVARISQAKMEGIVTTKLDNIQQDIVSLNETKSEQWDKINALNVELARCQALHSFKRTAK